MSQCNPVATPVATSDKLCANAGSSCEDPTLYRSLAGALQYLTFTRPDISYVVQQVCLYMHDPRIEHMAAIHRILHYVKGTLHYGLQLYRFNISTILSYTDADWGGCPDTRRSTSGYCVFLGDNLISWSAKRQPIISKSSAEAEYRGVANVVSETCWIRNLLLELHYPITSATLVYCDNISVVYLAGIQSIISALSILRSTFTLFVKKSNVVMFGYFMFHPVIRLLTFSPKAFLKYYLMIFFPVSASPTLPIRLRGCISILEYLKIISL
ncbi:uncharacterized mitochondrial protein AtMg00810-like [Amaranthus tricolor]|uniref:uncharacterized mitochondrial protein AtMg00810-like n=1 Tax=Amaranthus tricolor TaxID=29722 RepID=UPI002583B248|nr:uncharacterized mitochondrial protein AtMg00810-like [Amaranthus tricolor]